MDSYEINASTLFIVPMEGDKSCVYEYYDSYIVNMPVMKIIERSCLFFGSTFEGRKQGSCSLLSTQYKVPIIVEESTDILFFPTCSPASSNCMWVSYNNFEGVDRIDNKFSRLHFRNNIKFKVEVSYFTIVNQLVRCERLKKEFNMRKKTV